MFTKGSGKYLPRWLSLGLVGALAAHFAALVITAFSGSYMPESYWYRVREYIDPLFFQNYRVFAPEPPTQSNMMVYQFHDGDSWSPWSWPAAMDLHIMRQNRLSSHAELYDIYEGLADNIFTTTQRSYYGQMRENGKWETLPSFRVAFDHARKLALEAEADSVRFGVLVEHTSISEGEIIKSHSFHPFPSIPAKQ